MYRAKEFPAKGLLTVPLLVILSLAACQKPSHVANDGYSWDEAPPMVLHASLKDSLSPNALNILRPSDSEGIRVKYSNGAYASYFEYQANRQDVLRAVASLPFPKYVMRADTTCYQVPIKDLAIIRQRISDTEYEAASYFWDVNPNDFDIYECYKAPMKHILLISKTSNKVLHRIELVS